MHEHEVFQFCSLDKLATSQFSDLDDAYFRVVRRTQEQQHPICV